MPHPDLSRVKAIVDQALDQAPAERPAFVARACAGDEAVRREVESLLEQEDGEQPWCEGPILSLVPGNGNPSSLQPQQRIGPYRIVRMLGAGGMGEVALATRRDDFEKQVALKVVRPGQVSEDLTRRFHNERQILAQLEHPNVARILDGGTTGEGQPFFVMEYVDGRPIDEHCEQQELSVRERLRLFLEVCSALCFAHQNLIVHRDLKPSNILVTEEGVPKLLDFGIAKRLASEPGSELTSLTQRPMSLRYASPEQIDGRPITTRTDIYSLGVLLYRLLAGRHPYESTTDLTLELARAIREDEPSPPSAATRHPELGRRLAGDLDCIVLKAMRKEPEQRYGSVEQLADDVRRYLEGDVVVARKGSWTYHAGKLVRRHKLPLAAAAVVLVLTLGFGVIATALWRQAVHDREQAVFQHQRSEDVLDFMKGLFRASGPNQSKGEELTAREILVLGEKRIEEEVDEPLLQAELLATVGEIYARLGDYDRALAPRERAEYLLRQHYPDGHPALAKAINNLASWFYRTGEYDRAEGLYREALAMKLRFPPDEDVDVAKSWSNLATILQRRGDFEEAEQLYLRSLAMRRELYGPEDETVATALRSLGVLYFNRGDLEQAETPLRQALELRERIYDSEDTRIATALASLGRLRHSQHRYDDAEKLFLRALAIRNGRFDKDHLYVALSQLDLARLYLDAGKLEQGEPLLTQALETLHRRRQADSWEIAEAESVLGGYLAARGRIAEAETLLARSHRTLAAIRGERAIYTRDALRRWQALAGAQAPPERLAQQGVGAR